MQEQIAKLFAELGFKVDTRGLTAFTKKLNEVEAQMQNLSKAMDTNFTKLEKGLAKLQMATKRDLDIQKKRVQLAQAQKRFDAQKFKSDMAAGKLKLVQVKAEQTAAMSMARIQTQNAKTQSVMNAQQIQSNAAIMKQNMQKIQQMATLNRAHNQSLLTQAKLARLQGGARAVRSNMASSAPARAVRRVSARPSTVDIGGSMGAATSGVASFLPGFGAAYSIMNANKISQDLQAIESAMLAVSGSAEQAGSNMLFLKEIGAEMGKTVRSIAPEFTKILASSKGTALEGQERGIFTGFMKYGTVMGLDEEAMKGSFRAITQMVSKQQVYAEELRGQLAERLPAAVRIAAEVMTGGDTKALNKMMEAGQLDPNELLPKMAKYMEEMAMQNGAYAKALASSRVQQGRFNFQVERGIELFAKSGFDKAMTDVFKILEEGTRDSSNLIRALGEAFNFLLKPIEAVVNLTKIFSEDVLPVLSKNTGIAQGNLVALAGVGTMLLSSWGRVAVMFATVALVMEDIAVGLRGGDSYFGDFLKSLTPQQMESFTKLGASLKDLGMAFVELGGAVGQFLKEWADNGGLERTVDLITKMVDNLTRLVDVMAKLTRGDGVALSDVAQIGAKGMEIASDTLPFVPDWVGNFWAGLGDSFNMRAGFDMGNVSKGAAPIVAPRAGYNYQTGKANVTFGDVKIDLSNAIIGDRAQALNVAQELANEFQRAVIQFQDNGG